jgi:hypothetical protein
VQCTVGALGLPAVWQASTRRDEESWNHTALPPPLDETPIGTQLGAALICDRALRDHPAATTSANSVALAVRIRPVLAFIAYSF